MTTNDFESARWISRAVPAATRVRRNPGSENVEWVSPGHTLAQTFESPGAVAAVSLDITGPPDAGDLFAVDVRFAVRVVSATGAIVGELIADGPQLLWERMDRFIAVTPPAPPGEYTIVLEAVRETVGWYFAAPAPTRDDDGTAPVPLEGQAWRDGAPVEGVRMAAVETIPAPNPLFRTRFTLPSSASQATIAAVVLGCGSVTINGFRVGEEALEPAVTDYDRSVLYRTWEVAHLLRAGVNPIEIDAGRERFSARGGDIWGWYLAPWHREPMALARLDTRHADGTATTLVTDETWETAAGPVKTDPLYGGEQWVLEAADPAWAPVAVVAGPAGELRPATHPPVLAGPLRPPVSATAVSENSWVFDFGEVMTGRIRCIVSGGPGSRVTVVSGEQRDEDGNVLCENVLVAGAAQLDSLQLDREVDGYSWEPQFGYRGFRWMQVTTTGRIGVTQVRAVPLSTPLTTMGELTSSEPLLAWIDTATARTFRNNLHGIPTDTPIYEKNGWTADAHLATEGLLHHFDLRSSLGKWMDDHVEAQSPDGAIPQIVPSPGWGRRTDPAWSSSAVLIPWYLYREYGDTGVLARYETMARRFADGLQRRLEGGLWRDRTWGDWLAPGYGVGPEGMVSIGTMMSVTAFQHVAAILEALGRPDSEEYRAAARAAAGAYHREFFDPGAGHYRAEGTGYRQSLNVLPLAFDVVPAEHVESVRASLIDDLEGRTAGHLDLGAVGVRHLLPVLSAAGRDDLALTVLLQRTRPGWGVWFESGERTLLESWDADARSRNHYFLGSVSSWIQQRVGGLRLTAPGWSEFEVAPVCDDRVTHASMRHRTPLGDAAVSWSRGPGGCDLRVDVPTGSLARVPLAGEHGLLGPGEHRIRVQAQ
jgi:alpha-L-rhamnosidase